MKKVARHLKYSGIILGILVLISCPTFAFETNGLLPGIEILVNGMTRNMMITQNYRFPVEYNHVVVLLIGYGGASITLSKMDTEGDFLVMTGMGISSTGIAPFLKFGKTGASMSEVIEIGDKRSPFGVLWLLSWVDSENDPPYNYTLQISF